jgi:hypothetical protein
VLLTSPVVPAFTNDYRLGATVTVTSLSPIYKQRNNRTRPLIHLFLQPTTSMTGHLISLADDNANSLTSNSSTGSIANARLNQLSGTASQTLRA